MAHKLCRSFPNRFESRSERVLIERASEPESDKVIRHVDIAVAGKVLVITPQSSEAERWNRQGRIQRKADVWNPKFVSQSRHGAENLRHDVRVLVRVQVCQHNARVRDLLNLSAQFPVGIDLSGRNRRECVLQLFGERLASYKRASLDENHMAADIEARRLASQANGIVKGVPICHQSCGGENPVTVRVDDSGIHVTRKPEIVGVDDQSFQLKDIQLDAEVLLGIGAEGFKGFLQLSSRTGEVVIKLRVHHKLADRSLP